MSKSKVIIFHGTGPDPIDYWYMWLAEEVKKLGAGAKVPLFEKINEEPIKDTLKQVFSHLTFDENTILVGHSAGAPLILSILERVEEPIRQAILVAGFIEDLGSDMPVLQPSYNWERIKQNVKNIIFINSVNDPWKCDDKQGRIMFDKLGGTQIIKNEGHFGTATFHQKYDKFPFLLNLLDLSSES
jgi:predicted alpha/beta hydrolase family esterase